MTDLEIFAMHPPSLGLLSLIRERKAWGDKGWLREGEAIISGAEKTLGISRQQYRTAVKYLEEWGKIRVRMVDARGRIKGNGMMVAGELFPKMPKQRNNPQATHKQPTSNHLKPVDKEQVKGDSKTVANPQASEKQPQTYYIVNNKEGYDPLNIAVPAWVKNNPPVLSAFQEWVDYRMDHKQASKPASWVPFFERQAKMLLKLKDPVKALELAMARNWQAFLQDNTAMATQYEVKLRDSLNQPKASPDQPQAAGMPNTFVPALAD